MMDYLNFKDGEFEKIVREGCHQTLLKTSPRDSFYRFDHCAHTNCKSCYNRNAFREIFPRYVLLHNRSFLAELYHAMYRSALSIASGVTTDQISREES